MKYILAYDLGTGGLKTSLFDSNGTSVGFRFLEIETFFPEANFREQRPEDWWQAVAVTTKELITATGVDPEDILSLAVSGHSLGTVPIGQNGELLCEFVPIWNDARATKEAKKFFESTSEQEWYETTGNGFPPELYTVFKILWYRQNFPELYQNCCKFIGTKDYINYKLTGVLCTDHSYASGSGVYSLEKNAYDETYVRLSGIDPEKLPEIRKSTDVVGTVLPEIARQLGLSPNTKVCCGGVDNACMALGAGCIENGDVYTSLGTSAWIAVCDEHPVVDFQKKPYVFAHCILGKYVSATCIFSAGNSLKWVRDTLFAPGTSYAEIDALTQSSPLGANNLLFLPTLAGGSGLDKSPNARGSFVGLDLMHQRADVARATLEGICINLRLALDVLKEQVPVNDPMLIVGGGAKSAVWRQIFADAYASGIITSTVAQDAGSFGAAIVAAVGVGLWDSFDRVKELTRAETHTRPIPQNVSFYERILPLYQEILDYTSTLGDKMQNLQMKG